MGFNRTMHSTILIALITVFYLSTMRCNNVCKVKSEMCRPTSKFCDKLCENGKCEIRAAVILPNDTNKHIASLPIVLPLLNKSIMDAKESNLIPSWLNITLIPKDDQCNPSYAQIATIESYSKKNCIHVIFGPVCDYCLATVSRTVQFFGTPLLTAGGFSSDFDKDKRKCGDEYYMLMRTGLLFSKGLSQFFTKIALSYNWHKVAFLYDKEGQKQVAGASTCSFMMQSLAQDLKNSMEYTNQQFQYKDGDLGLSTFSIEEFLKKDIGVNYGIIVMCASRERVHEILLAAVSLNAMMYEGEYVFFNIELNSTASYLNEPWKDEKYNKTVTKQLKDAYKNIITLTSLTEEVENSTEIRTKSNYSSGFYDAMMLYLNVLKDFIQEGGPDENTNTTINGYSMVCNMFGRNFSGLNGLVEMNQNGDRKTHYSLLSYNPFKDKFDVVANYEKDANKFSFIEGKEKFWRVPKEDTPTCGYDFSKCPDSFPQGFLTTVLILILIIVVTALFIYKRNIENNAVYAKNWLIRPHEIQFFLDRPDENGHDSASVASILSGIETQQFMPIYIYKNIKVAAKIITNNVVDLHKQTHWLRLKQMLDLQHDNLIKFYGICEEPMRFVLIEYGSRGSLQDILKTFKMNERTSKLITMSFILDIIKGMDYLHNSEIKSHGTLSSSNCVVDSRLVVKITDFGLHFLYDNTSCLEDETYWRKKLWTAPELLRAQEPVPTEGTQKGDVYSFAIIFHEIMVRKGPFYLGDHVHLLTKNIVESVKNGTILRPLIDESSGDKEVADLMRRCWAEDVADRPDFAALKNTIRKLNKKHDSGNILDNLLSRLEQYANNLETLVEERTADYLDEKRKCEDLLYQLLPKSVASQLINGKSVIAETYDQVTIYFSDIVGFTYLAAVSAPMEVVEFLNDLYTAFDKIIGNFDVYKVETIGDAYMVVSGLPNRSDKLHAREIARMGIALLETVHTFKIKHRPKDQLKIRIGMHTGPCVAGVVGQKMPRYCLFGDTVNTASRMESNGQSQRIHVSSTTKELLDYFGNFDLEMRGEVDLKGKGKMVTWWLNGEKVSAIHKSPAYLQQQEASRNPLGLDDIVISSTNTPLSSSSPAIHKTRIPVVSSSPLHVATTTVSNTTDQPQNDNLTNKFKNSVYFDQNVDDEPSSTSATVPLLSITSHVSSERDS